MALNKGIFGFDFDLKTQEGIIPVHTIGSGEIISKHPYFARHLEIDWLIYATLHDSNAYGNQAFWFARHDLLVPLLDNKADHEGQDPILREHTRLRRVDVNEGWLSVSNEGLSTYTAEQVGDQKFEIRPDGYS